MRDKSKIINLMTAWIGATQGDEKHKFIVNSYNARSPRPRNHKLTYTEAWCAATVSAAAYLCGYDDFIPFECSCGKLVDQAKSMGIWEESDSIIPPVGALIIYDWSDTGKGDDTTGHDHVGIVDFSCSTYFTVIEGNYNKAVRRRTVQRNAKYIRGFILPKYDEGEVYYTVKKGDTLSKLAKTYDTTVDQLLTWNKKRYPKISKNYIQVGWELKVR